MHRFLPILPILLFSLGLNGQQTVGLFLNDSLSVNGYTLFSPNTSTYLIDNCGEVVNTWTSLYQAGSSVYLLENGNLLRTNRVAGSFNGGGVGGRLELRNWGNDLLWSYNYANSEHQQHHDIEILPNGNVLILAWEARTGVEAIQAGRDPSLIGFAGVWPEQIVEIEIIGTGQANIVWEWHLWDHLIQDFDPSKDNFGVVAEHPELVDINFEASTQADWIHLNAINYNPELDQIVMSSRVFREIWIIDHSTTTAEAAGHTGGNAGKGGDLLYRWGNPQAYDRGTSAEQRLFAQHDVRWIPEGYPNAGQLMVFNNGAGRPQGLYSTVDRWMPPMDNEGNYLIEDGQPFGPSEVEWSYIAPEPSDFFSQNISGAHPLDNGNILVCSGRQGWFFELTPDHEIVWSYINPVSINGPVPQGFELNNQNIFRATRYPSDFPGFLDKDLTPQGPLELDPLPSDCKIFEEEDPVQNVVENAPMRGVSVLQNPIMDVLSIQNANQLGLSIRIYSINGQEVWRHQGTDELIEADMAHLPGGIYVISFSNPENKRIQTQRILKL